MNVTENRIYKALEVLANFLFLNVLWLFVAAPIFTIFPATTALFGVVKDWITGKDNGFFFPFLRHLRKEFLQSLFIGAFWIPLGLILLLDIYAIYHMTGIIKLLLIPFTSIICLLYLAASVYIFPVAVTYRLKSLHIIRNSLLYALSYPHMTFVNILIATCIVYLAWLLPLSVLITPSVGAYTMYLLCNNVFLKVERIRGLSRSEEEIKS
ncbi:DUF624 domain-containing protein [Thermobaculum terrenum]